MGLANKILSVGCCFHGLGKPEKLLGIDEALCKRDFFRTGDLHALTLLDDLDELRRFEQRFVSAGVEPCITPAKSLNMELAAFEVPLVQVGDLEFSASGRFHLAHDL